MSALRQRKRAKINFIITAKQPRNYPSAVLLLSVFFNFPLTYRFNFISQAVYVPIKAAFLCAVGKLQLILKRKPRGNIGFIVLYYSLQLVKSLV